MHCFIRGMWLGCSKWCLLPKNCLARIFPFCSWSSYAPSCVSVCCWIRYAGHSRKCLPWKLTGGIEGNINYVSLNYMFFFLSFLLFPWKEMKQRCFFLLKPSLPFFHGLKFPKGNQWHSKEAQGKYFNFYSFGWQSLYLFGYWFLSNFFYWLFWYKCQYWNIKRRRYPNVYLVMF